MLFYFSELSLDPSHPAKAIIWRSIDLHAPANITLDNGGC